MNILPKLIETLSSEIERLEASICDLKAHIQEQKDEIKKSNTNTRVYRENLLEAHSKNKELQDFMAQMLVNIGTPICKEIKKYKEQA